METASNTQTKSRALPKPNNIITVPYSYDDIEFYRWWCKLLNPFISLTGKEMDVVAHFLLQRHELSKCTSDPTILDTMVMSGNIKAKVMEECNITKKHLYVIMSTLRKRNVIVGNVINPRLIPNNRQEDNGVFQLLILFRGDTKA